MRMTDGVIPWAEDGSCIVENDLNRWRVAKREMPL